MEDSIHRFRVFDYVLFGLTIVISVIIGLYYALSGGKQRTTSEYLLAGRRMSFLPVAISLFVSFESSIMMLGLPAEGYMYGAQIFIGLVANLLANLLSPYIVAPLMYPLNISSAYEYLELRFKSRAVRLLSSVLSIATDLWYMGIVLFGPAVALQAVTGFPLWMSIGGLALIAVLYTAIGGLKAVIWTDVFQTVIMFSGIFAVLIKGTIDVGGPKRVWNVAQEGGRLQFFNFDLDPRTRHTFFNLGIGYFIRGFHIGFRQSTVQRISSTKSLRDAKRVMLLMAPLSFLVSCLAFYEGIVSYAFFQNKQCDPFASNKLSNPNQIIPYIVMDIFQSIPGMPGLFIASLFSASLSTVSSCLSASSVLVWTDFVHPLVGDIPDWKATFIAKISVVVFGVLACCIAFLISLIGGTLQQISAVILSSFAGPLAGMFFLGCYCPRSTAKGVVLGCVLSLALIIWISGGMSFTPGLTKTSPLPPASTDNCDLSWASHNYTSILWSNQTTSRNPYSSTVAMDTDHVSSEGNGPQGIQHLYTMSYTWIPVISTLSCIFFGYIFSLITGPNQPGDVPSRYLIAVSDSLLVFLPKGIRRRISAVGTQFMNRDRQEDPIAKVKGALSDIPSQEGVPMMANVSQAPEVLNGVHGDKEMDVLKQNDHAI